MANTKQLVLKRDEQRIIPLLWTGDEPELTYDIILAEPGAEVQLFGLLLGSASQSLVLNVTVTHAAPRTTSKILVNAALQDSAKVDVNGLLRIMPGARGSDSWLGAHILLSEDAKGLAVPALEILENDIVAGHATTVGRIDEMQIFYLMSRGLSRELARKLIVSGFLQDIIERFPAPLAARARKVIDV